MKTNWRQKHFFQPIISKLWYSILKKLVYECIKLFYTPCISVFVSPPSIQSEEWRRQALWVAIPSTSRISEELRRNVVQSNVVWYPWSRFGNTVSIERTLKTFEKIEMVSSKIDKFKEKSNNSVSMIYYYSFMNCWLMKFEINVAAEFN